MGCFLPQQSPPLAPTFKCRLSHSQFKFLKKQSHSPLVLSSAPQPVSESGAGGSRVGTNGQKFACNNCNMQGNSSILQCKACKYQICQGCAKVKHKDVCVQSKWVYRKSQYKCSFCPVIYPSCFECETCGAVSCPCGIDVKRQYKCNCDFQFNHSKKNVCFYCNISDKTVAVCSKCGLSICSKCLSSKYLK